MRSAWELPEHAALSDVRGRTQPLWAAPDDQGYFFDAVVRRPVVVP